MPQAVIIEDENINLCPDESGAPQASILGPSLFLYYTNNISIGVSPTIRHHCRHGNTIHYRYGGLDKQYKKAYRSCLFLLNFEFAPGFVNYKKGALDLQPQVIKFTNHLPIVGGFLRVLRLLPPLKLVAMILLKVALNTKNQLKSIELCYCSDCVVFLFFILEIHIYETCIKYKCS